MEKLIDAMISKIQKKHYPLIAFMITAILLLLLFTYAGLMPGGDKSILVSDLYGQYYDFLNAYRNMITGGKSFLYSWNIGMGLSLVGWFAYYTASPLNLILLLFPEHLMISGITLLIILKLSLSAWALCRYLKKTLNQDGIEVILFSCCYALSGFAVNYYFNVMWLDALILLPLLLVEVGKLIGTKKVRGLISVLFILFFSNYYMAYMVGIFSFFYFCAYYVYYKKFGIKEFAGAFLRFIGCAVAAACMDAVVLVPTFFQMMNLKGGVKRDTISLLPGFDPATLYNNLFLGSYTSLEKGKPLIYTGVITLLLLPLYFLNRKISKKEKVIVGGLFGIFYLIMSFPCLDLIMHVGEVPTWFNYRYSFFISFLLAVVGCRQFPFLVEEKTKKVFYIIAANTGFLILWFMVGLCLSHTKIPIDMNVPKLLINIAVIWGYGGMFYYAVVRKARRKDVYAILFLLISFEVVTNGYLIIHNIDKEVGYRSTKEILEEKELTKKALKELGYGKGNEFYRVEKNYTATMNDSMGQQYNGIAHFSSVYNKRVNEVLYHLGIWVNNWQVKFCGSTELTNSIFNIKEIFHTRKKQLFLASNKVEKNFYIDRNRYYLPIGFMVDESMKKYSFAHDKLTNALENQKKLLETMTGKESVNCFKRIYPVEIELDNVALEVKGGKKIYHKIDKMKEAYITYHILKEKKEASYYFYFQYDNSKKKQKLLVKTDNLESIESAFVENQTTQVPFNLKLGEKDMQVKIDFWEEDKIILDDEIFYYIDKEEYEKNYNELNQHTLKLTDYGDTYIKGNVNVADKTLLYTSIPYDKGWIVKIDGVKTKIKPLLDNAFIGISLSKGSHTVEFSFLPKGFRFGIVVTIIGFLLFCAIFILKL